jgi:hypothetical protein
MIAESFIKSCATNTAPNELSPALRALWLDRHGDWDGAHASVQEESDKQSAAVHAYLHRKEGDLWNARYWYTKAGRKPFSGSLEDEWEALLREFLPQAG